MIRLHENFKTHIFIKNSYMQYLILALAPVIILTLYVYFRDKYEREPIGLLLLAMLGGAISVVPIIFLERYVSGYDYIFDGQFGKAFYTAFFVASFSEEIFKLLIFMIFIWGRKNFNEKMDGIVYAVFISMGFALVENIFYVYGNSDHFQVGIVRAFTAVPGHMLFGVAMGFYLGRAKFLSGHRGVNLFLAFLMPFLLHGFYDFILMAKDETLLLLFIPFIIFMWFFGLRRIKWHVKDSPFNSKRNTA